MRSPATLCPTLHWLKTEGPLSSEPPMVNGRTRRVYTATDAGRRAMAKDQQALWKLAHKVLGYDAL
ncbi:helix-turn-helix transcriptional regulator [Streptomyces sp. NPDC059378]|uniref:helix-turn-helix transcriptional regulator n=1 Tax=Streptomyces sp. NPDC059378 TaxID=3346815 RepID=UPI00369DA932